MAGVNDDPIVWARKPPVFSNPACAAPGIDPEIFFPFDSDPALEARAICRGCEHVVACAEFAMSDGRIQGVWGGLTWAQRKDLRRQINAGKVN